MSSVGFSSQPLSAYKAPPIKEESVEDESHDALLKACQEKSEGLTAGDQAVNLLREGASLFGTSQAKRFSNALSEASKEVIQKVLKYLKTETYSPLGEKTTYHVLIHRLPSDVINIITEYNEFSGLNQIQRLMYGREGDIGTREWDDSSVAVKVAENGDLENFNGFLELGFDWNRPMYGLMWKYTSSGIEARFSCNWGYRTPLRISFNDYIFKQDSLKTSTPTTYLDTINFVKIPDSIILRVKEAFIPKNKKKRRIEEVD